MTAKPSQPTLQLPRPHQQNQLLQALQDAASLPEQQLPWAGWVIQMGKLAWDAPQPALLLLRAGCCVPAVLVEEAGRLLGKLCHGHHGGLEDLFVAAVLLLDRLLHAHPTARFGAVVLQPPAVFIVDRQQRVLHHADDDSCKTDGSSDANTQYNVSVQQSQHNPQCAAITS